MITCIRLQGPSCVKSNALFLRSRGRGGANRLNSENNRVPSGCAQSPFVGGVHDDHPVEASWLNGGVSCFEFGCHPGLFTSLVAPRICSLNIPHPLRIQWRGSA